MTANHVRSIFPVAAIVALLVVTKQPSQAAVVINEIDANQTGSTDLQEFVELSGPANLSLSGYVVVFFNGATNASYLSFDLDGYQLGNTGFFLLGNPGVVPTPDIIFPTTTLQNGPDAVALYLANAADFPLGTPATSTNLVDAINYGSSSNPPDTALMAILGQSTQFIDTDTTSISRVPDGTGPFTENTVPTPMNSGIPQVPEPSTILLGVTLVGLVTIQRRTR
ncbi:MAG TPA: hypothetical protein VH107_15180 [Lacipirellulaceae bacterium]|jgi:hypothetical protein|nr:hypothetical protein [Lacipirellulaceae bacterium]